MDFFKCTILRKRTTTRSRSFSEPTTPMSPVSSVLDEVEDDENDYSPCIQQEAAGIRLQKNERLMIEEMDKALVRWSGEHKEWLEKWNRTIQKKDANFYPYTTTRKVFLAAISALNQVAVQFDESSKELKKILCDVPKKADRSIKSELAQEISTLKEAKQILDDLEKRQKQVKADLDRTQENLGDCPLNTRKHTKLQGRCESLKQERKELRQELQVEKETFRQAQQQYRTNMDKIYQQSQAKELTRLTNMPEPLRKFVNALKIEPALLKEAIEKHAPKADLASWQEKHFSPSFKQTAV